MSLFKQAKDILVKGRDKAASKVFGKTYVPSGLADIHHYFRTYEPINFKTEQQEDGSFVAVSENFHYGTIITHGNTPEELSEKIKDAILTAFEVPSSYAKEASIHRIGEEEYAFA